MYESIRYITGLVKSSQYVWRDKEQESMAGSTFGKILTMTTWGESHGAGIGVVVDGCPAGLLLAEEDIQKYLDRRKPGQSRYTTKRNESDSVEIMSGVCEGRMQIIPLIKNMVSGTTAGAEDPRAGKPSAEWRPELWRPRFWRALESG